MTEFLPHQVRFTSHLHRLLKKDTPPWSSVHTQAVKSLKALAQSLPTLQIPSTSLRIRQSDASDTQWGAVLLEEFPDKTRRVCGYRSGMFKPSEQHYHSTFKEILAVHRGIEKFQFFLIGHTFQLEMDMTAFPRMLQFKQKQLPESQLLRWAQ
ncbi:uncharacterized protein LOC122665809 [Telopea speciosissima]|uniref:uncharacterized protein LOC122665809 n=1 Tax=Telopea speciosissima TaxID=54955 RepID=UPI001CC381E5|nr:uncharacterized protein LOC122665809 [Telopea speciosissima]